MTGLLLVEPPLKFFGTQPVSRVLVGQSGIDPALVFGIGSVPEVKQKGGYFALLGWRKRGEAVFDLFNAHGRKV